MKLLFPLVISLAYGVCLADTWATWESKTPQPIQACDKIKPGSIVIMNISIWNHGGWPLYRVTCYWR